MSELFNEKVFSLDHKATLLRCYMLLADLHHKGVSEIMQSEFRCKLLGQKEPTKLSSNSTFRYRVETILSVFESENVIMPMEEVLHKKNRHLKITINPKHFAECQAKK